MQRIRAEYAERRRRSAYSPAGTPHTSPAKPAADTSPEDREAALRQRWAEGGVLFSKTFPDQLTDLAANDVAREFAEARIRELVADPAVADDLIPVDHPIGTKRICTDTGYYETFNRAHVTLVNLRREPLTAVTADAMQTTTSSYPCDALVFATGFDAMTGALGRIDPVGPGGARLSDLWAEGPITFLGLMIPTLPNLFSFSGPGSPSVLANMVLHAEVQVDWVIELIIAARSTGRQPGRTARGRRRRVDPTRHRGRGGYACSSAAASSWYLGANIEGKKRVFMPYIGGFGATGDTATRWPRTTTPEWCSRRVGRAQPLTPAVGRCPVHETIQQVLRDRMQDDAVAVRYAGRTWTWREHLAEAAAEASAMIGRPTRRGRCTSGCCSVTHRRCCGRWPLPRWGATCCAASTPPVAGTACSPTSVAPIVNCC